MIPRLSGHFSIFGVVFFVLKSLLGIARQWSLEKFAILTLKPRSHDRILIYRTWTIECFHMTSRRPYWCPKTMKRRRSWCSKPVLWALNSFLMQTLSFVPLNLHRWWPREWKRSIEAVLYYSAILTFAVGNTSRPRRHISGKSIPMSISSADAELYFSVGL